MKDLTTSPSARGALVEQPRFQPITVSVVVACRNEIRHIRAFLSGLLRQEVESLGMEVLIADGMSVDGTRLILHEFENQYPFIRILDNPERIAPTGLNRAIREAKGELVLRMDVHTIYARDYIRSCVELLLETGAQNVGARLSLARAATSPNPSRTHSIPDSPAAVASSETHITKARRGRCPTVAGASRRSSASACSMKPWFGGRTMS